MRSAPRKPKSRKPKARKTKPRKPAAPPKPVDPPIDNDDDEKVKQLRLLAHDLSNALEAILQSCYLLKRGKLNAGAKRWAQLIDKASEDAARINREMRAALRALSGE
jgi:hypothetical protein